MKTVLEKLSSHGGHLWLLDSEIPRYFDSRTLLRAVDRGHVSVQKGSGQAVRIELTFKGRQHLRKLDKPLALRLWLFLSGFFVHRLDA